MKKLNIKKPAILLAAAVILLGASAVGTTRSLPSATSDTYIVGAETKTIGTAIVENGTVNNGTLMSALDEKILLNKAYDEKLAVTNTGTIDEYVRVTITKSWKDANGDKITSIDPAYINLNLTGGKWIVDTSKSTTERTVLYYSEILPVGTTTDLFADTVTINGDIASLVSVKDGNYTYAYNDMTFTITVKADGLQTHNATAAMKNSWGIDPTSIGLTVTE